MRYFLSSFAKSIVIVIVVIIIALARDRRESQRDERERKVFMHERKFYENRIQNASSHRHKKTAEYSTTTLLYRMLFTSSATFVGAFAGVCTQMYACALRKVPLFHREYCSPFLLCLLLRHHHHHHHHRVAALRNRLSFQSRARVLSLSLSLSLYFMYIKHTT